VESNFDASKALVERANELDQASIEVKKALRPQNVFKIVLDLSKAKPEGDAYVINKPFKSFTMQKSTSPSALISVRPTTNTSEQDAFDVGPKDSWGVSMSVPKAYIHWDAQPGVVVTLVFFSDAEFRSGSQLSLNAGGVSINEGSSITQLAPVVLAPATITQIMPQNLFRNVGLVINDTAADMYVGDATVTNAGATKGMILKAGDTLKWRNTAALFGYSVLGGTIQRIEQQ
jgi:hypothetical protein